MTLVVDASVAFKWFVPVEPLFRQAVAVWREEPALIAPDLVIVEVCNAAWRAARIGAIAQAQALQIAEELPRFFQSLIGAAALAASAMSIARQLEHPVHDCFYLALAEQRRCRLVTADNRLLGKLKAVSSIDVLNLADYRP